jgi:uncharacterized protein YggE
MKATFQNNTILLLALAVLALGIWRPQAPTAALAQGTPSSERPDRTVHVSGTAVIYVTPDRALLQLGVQSSGVNPDAVQKDNARTIANVIGAVKAQGVESKDIATDYYIVYPMYEDYNSLHIKGYRIDNTIAITVRNVQQVGEILVAALLAGANEVQDVQFYTSELRKYRDQAREMAMQAAGEKARDLALAAGAQVDGILTISENSWSQYYGSWRGGREAALWAQNAIQNAASPQGDPSQADDALISLGQITVRAEVNATYLMLDTR